MQTIVSQKPGNLLTVLLNRSKHWLDGNFKAFASIFERWSKAFPIHTSLQFLVDRSKGLSMSRQPPLVDISSTRTLLMTTLVHTTIINTFLSLSHLSECHNLFIKMNIKIRLKENKIYQWNGAQGLDSRQGYPRHYACQARVAHTYLETDSPLLYGHSSTMSPNKIKFGFIVSLILVKYGAFWTKGVHSSLQHRREIKLFSIIQIQVLCFLFIWQILGKGSTSMFSNAQFSWK